MLFRALGNHLKEIYYWNKLLRIYANDLSGKMADSDD